MLSLTMLCSGPERMWPSLNKCAKRYAVNNTYSVNITQSMDLANVCCMDEQTLGGAQRAFRSDVNFLMYFSFFAEICPIRRFSMSIEYELWRREVAGYSCGVVDSNQRSNKSHNKRVNIDHRRPIEGPIPSPPITCSPLPPTPFPVPMRPLGGVAWRHWPVRSGAGE